MSNNRRAVVVRLTDEEYQGLQQLAGFWQCDERKVMKLAIAQLYQASVTTQEKLRADAAAKDKEIAWETSLKPVLESQSS